MTPAFTALICGGRDYTDRDVVFRTLDKLLSRHENLTILCDSQPGGDVLAWAVARGRPCITDPRGVGALLAYLPHGCVAFSDDDTAREAEAAGVAVWRVGR